MVDIAPQNISSKELTTGLMRLRESVDELEEALAGTFNALAEKGIEPTYHLKKGQASLRKRLGEVERIGARFSVQLERLNQLVHTTMLLTSSLDIEQVLEEVIDTIIALTGAERAYLMLYNDRKELEIQTARNWDQETLGERDISLSRSVIEAAVTSGEPVVTTNAQLDKRFANQESIVLHKLRSIVCVPLVIGGKPVGVLYADNRFHVDAFSEDMIPILSAFGTQAAIVIANARIFGQVQSELKQAQKVIQRLSIELDKDLVDEQVAEITESSYFRELAEAARQIRQRR